MKMHPLYPMSFRPCYKAYAWGGERIAARYNRGGAPPQCAESWELSGLEGTPSIVTNGAFEGVTLSHLMRTFGRDLVGLKAANEETFPLAVRLLNAREQASLVSPQAELQAAEGKDVQVARRLWYFLETPTTAEEKVDNLFDLPTADALTLNAGSLVYEVLRLGTGAAPEVDARVPVPWPPQARRDLQMRLTTPVVTFATLTLQRARALHTTVQSCMVLFCTEGKATLDHNGPHPLTLLAGDVVLVPPKQSVFLQPLAPTQLLVTTL